ncbi:MAG: TIGR02099 family protein [Proteobacteria bacterium]|nr:TIGR02099 family protein [Pseudomonadota bacterium]
MRRLLERILSLLWTSVAVLLIGGAALVTLVRMLLPQLGEQRAAVETWLTDIVGRPVEVGAISANWSGWAPRLTFDRLVILDERRQAELIHFERADVDIALLESLQTRELKPTRLIVTGVAMNLVRDLNGQFSVVGMPPPHSPVMRWLLEQSNFAVRQADLTVNDQRAQASYALSGLRLTIQSRGRNKTITAYADLPDMIGRHATLEIHTRGNPLDVHWEGNIDARLDGINSDYLLRQADWHGPRPEQAPVNLVAWSTWRDGALRHSDFELAIERSRDDQGHVLEARGQLQKRDDSWRLALADIALPGVAGAKGNGRLSAAWRSGPGIAPRLAVRAAALPLEPIAALVTRMSAPGTLRDALLRAQPRGRLARLDALWLPRGEAPPRFYVAAKVAALAMQDAAQPRAIDGLSFEIKANGGGGHVEFDDSVFTVTDDRRLAAPLDIERMEGALSWRKRGESPLTARAHGLRARVAGHRLGLDGDLEYSPGSAPRVDVSARFAADDATRLQALLPIHLMPGHGEEWARHLVDSGHVERGRVIIKGPLDRFPFSDKSGEFSATFSVRDATLHYAPHWPPAVNVDGEVAVRGAALAIDITRGTISGADITGAHLALPDMGVRERMLEVKGVARGRAAHAIELVRNSPLKNGRAARLTELDISGDVVVPLDMRLGLYPDGPHEVRGEARFNGNRITELKQNLVLDEVVGSVAFTHHDWHGEGLRAIFDGTPVDLDINGALHDPHYDSEFHMAGISSAQGLGAYLEKYTPPVHAWLARHRKLDALSGQVAWRAALKVPSSAGLVAGAPQRLTIDSTLAGLTVELPWPLGKSADALRPLHIETAIHDHVAVATRIDMSDMLSVELDAARDAAGRARLTRAELVFGSLAPQFKGTPGLSIAGYIALLPLTEWTHFAQAMPADGDDYLDALPLTLDVQVSELRMLGRKFKDTRINGTRETERWNLTASGPDVSGRIEIPRDAAHGVLRLDLDHLHLRRALKAAPAGSAPELDPRRLPAFEMHCAQFRYGKIELGQADVYTSRHASGLTLDKLHFSDENFSIVASGDWQVEGEQHHSKFDIAVEAKALGKLLSRFGYRVGNIKHGSTAIDIQAHWNGTPADFALARINGSFELNVGNGRFLDIDPGTGRLFGLLSLQALPRRLTLDFEDLFDKGLVFDRIAGVFQLQDGNAYTNSLLIEGPSARFDIAGRTGLAAKDYDQHIVVTPALSNSLPLAGALFGPIGAGAGAAYFIGSKMFKSIPEQMNKFLSRKYTITGSWDNPVVKRI